MCDVLSQGENESVYIQLLFADLVIKLLNNRLFSMISIHIEYVLSTWPMINDFIF